MFHAAQSKYRWFSRLTLHWLSAFLDVGFSRPLEKEGELDITAEDLYFLKYHFRSLGTTAYPTCRDTRRHFGEKLLRAVPTGQKTLLYAL